MNLCREISFPLAIKGYAESVVCGIGKIDLGCMHDGCEVDFPPSQIQFLDEKLRKQIADRQQHEGVRLAFADPDNEELLPCKMKFLVLKWSFVRSFVCLFFCSFFLVIFKIVEG